MIVSVGLQIMIIAALALTLLLVGYTVYVRVRQSTFTEKRFNFVALWSCIAVVTIALQVVFNIPIIEALFAKAGLSIEPPDQWTKMLAAFLAVFYVWRVSKWAMSWNGRLSEDGYRARELGIPSFFVLDGAKETLRILKREQASPERREKGAEPPELPPPLPELPFHEQVRELMVGRWPEYIIDDDDWIGDGCCWKGFDTSLNQPLLVVCGTDESEVDLGRIRALAAHLAEDTTRVIAVFDEFRNRNAFKSGLKQLSDTAKMLTFDELVVEAVPHARYKREIDRYFREDPLPGADFPISEVLVPARAYRGLAVGPDGTRSDGEPFDLESHVADRIGDGSPRQLALLGTYGQGKSTAALALTHKLLFDRDFAERCNNRIPLLIRLTGLSPKTSSPEALLGQWGSRLGLNGRALLALHRAGRTVLILDAFDEMANVSDRADRFDHFASLWQFACPGAKILFTGRPNFFLDDEELKRALGISEGVAVGPYCAALGLAPFDKDQIAQALRWMPPTRVQIFLRKLEELPKLFEIARRPSLLFQASQLWDMGRIDIERGNVYSGSVIREFVTYSLERQIKKQRTDMTSGRHDRQFIPLTLAELDYFTCGCAVAALSEGRNNSLPAPVLRLTVSRLLEDLAGQALSLSLGEGGALAMPLKERLADRPDPAEAIVQAVRTHGVIEHDPSKAGLYKFSHKSFAEALSAEVITFNTIGIKHSVSRPNRLVIARISNQDAVLLFSMDMAAANLPRARDTTFSKMLSNITATGELLSVLIFVPTVSVALVERKNEWLQGKKARLAAIAVGLGGLAAFITFIATVARDTVSAALIFTSIAYMAFGGLWGFVAAKYWPLVLFIMCLEVAIDRERKGAASVEGNVHRITTHFKLFNHISKLFNQIAMRRISLAYDMSYPVLLDWTTPPERSERARYVGHRSRRAGSAPDRP